MSFTNEYQTSNNLKFTLGMIIIFFIIDTNLYSKNQPSGDTINKSILERQRVHKATELIHRDSLAEEITITNEPMLPGGISETFTPLQDLNYERAMRLRIPPVAQLEHDLQMFEKAIEIQRRLASGSTWETALKNINEIPPEALQPSKTEIVMHETNIINSFYVPFVRTYPQSGVRIPLSAIGAFLGLIEDVSPEIKYNLEFTSEVEIVIYSVQATVIATLYKGWQKFGNQSIWWNGRDDKGKKMPPGDYIAEVRVGKIKYIRKRIVI
ncbi:MAG: FlgD ig protein [Ignavibacteria bacterium]|nr:FlgD ig protein [Ignavibacteria bacterium]